MRRILPGAILTYNQYGYLKIPQTVKCLCPKCGKPGEFTLKTNYYQVKKKGLFAEGLCSKCGKTSEFVIMYNDCLDQRNNGVEVYVHDSSASTDFSEQIEHNKNVPIELFKAYRAALNASQSDDNSATTVISKRVLESVLKTFLGKEVKGKSLLEQFEQLPKHTDLNKPVQNLGYLVHPDSPFYKMFELELEIDDEMIVLLMEFLKILMEYLFVLPEKVESLHSKIEQKFK